MAGRAPDRDAPVLRDEPRLRRPAGGELQAGALVWRLLLELDSECEPAEVMWGDVGRIYFWMRGPVMAAGRADAARAILQCGVSGPERACSRVMRTGRRREAQWTLSPPPLDSQLRGVGRRVTATSTAAWRQLAGPVTASHD
jgi:hypothetical protein